MASKAKDYFDDDVEEGLPFIRRLVYDVLVYALPKCGFPEENLPPTDLEENVYSSDDFIARAGLSALRVSLLLRDRWRLMFLSRHKGSGFTKDNTPNFLRHVVLCCPLSWIDTTQSIVEAFLAVCNEVVLFFHYEGVKIDINLVMDSVSKYITGFVRPYPNVPEKMEELLSKIYNIPGYSMWMTNFIEKYAIPYGSREDVSTYFFGYVRKQWTDFSQMPDFPERLTITELRDYLGFLPDDMFSIIENADPTEIPENTVSAPETILPDDLESFEPRKVLRSSESGDAGGEDSYGRRSTNLSGVTTQGAECSKASSDLEEEFRQMRLGFEISQAIQGAIPKRKTSKKKKK